MFVVKCFGALHLEKRAVYLMLQMLRFAGALHLLMFHKRLVKVQRTVVFVENIARNGYKGAAHQRSEAF